MILLLFKKLGFSYTNYVIDDDSQTQEIINNFNEQSLFDEKSIYTQYCIKNYSSGPESIFSFVCFEQQLTIKSLLN